MAPNSELSRAFSSETNSKILVWFPGQLMGFLAIVEAIIPVAFNPLYSSVFAATLATFPGCFYLLTAGVSAVALLAYL